MYESETRQAILNRMIQRVREADPNLDIRQSSPAYNSVAPAAVEFSNLYAELSFLDLIAYGSTAPRHYLILLAKERGIDVLPATKATRYATFTFTSESSTVPLGSRFSVLNNEINFVVTERISSELFYVACETPGVIGNQVYGQMQPVLSIPGLATAMLGEVVIPGEDEEDTEHFRQRYLDSLNAQAYGGNRKDYQDMLNTVEGVGNFKLFPLWDGGYSPNDLQVPDGLQSWLSSATLPDEIRDWIEMLSGAVNNGVLTVGNGTIRIYMLDSTGSIPSAELVNRVQETIDPIDKHGEGVGLAPINHYVTILPAIGEIIDIQTYLSYRDGITWNDVAIAVREVIEQYFLELANVWGAEQYLVARISQIESRLLDIDGIIDIANTKINGIEQNFTLDEIAIPLVGEIIAI